MPTRHLTKLSPMPLAANQKPHYTDDVHPSTLHILLSDTLPKTTGIEFQGGASDAPSPGEAECRENEVEELTWRQGSRVNLKHASG